MQNFENLGTCLPSGYIGIYLFPPLTVALLFYELQKINKTILTHPLKTSSYILLSRVQN